MVRPGPTKGTTPDVLRALKVAAVFLTRMPVRVEGALSMRDLAEAAHAFPLVGALVGLAGGAAFWAAHAAGLPGLPAAVLAVAATAGITGALHEDGLADTADALGAGPDRVRALEIMRDSRIGSFGTVALVLALLARVAALASVPGPALGVALLAAAGAASRAVMPAVMLAQPSARAEGLAAGAGRPGALRVAAGMGLAAGIAAAALPPAPALSGLLAAAVAGRALASVLGRRFGGCTGDTLGAVQQVAEVAFLYAALAWL